MPRVSAEHRAARRRQILDAARRCFVRGGIHTTSMQDVIREADLSVGAVYGYFRSKDELIQAIAEDVLTVVGREFAQQAGTHPLPPLPVVMDRILGVVDTQTGPDGIARVAVQIWGESTRDPRLKALVVKVYGTVRANFVRLAAQARDEGQLPPDADPEQVGAVLFGLVPGYVLQRVLVGGVTRADYLAGLDALLAGATVRR